MIRTILLTTALIAVAGVADAAAIKVSLTGKTEAAVKAELAKAAELVCADAPVLEHLDCVRESYKGALSQLEKAKAIRTASLTF